jgi:pullulanase
MFRVLTVFLRRSLCLCVILCVSVSVFSYAQQPDYMKYPVYNGTDLGLTYSPNSSSFRIWSPVAEKVQLCLYKEALGGEPVQRMEMNKSDGGTWTLELQGDKEGIFYSFRVYINGSWRNEVPDPYAKIVGVNGRRAMVGDPGKTKPSGWANDKSPAFNNATDAVIYELHVRDASIHSSSGIGNKGKFIGLAETGTRNGTGQATGLDHMKELGITHVHLLPSYDFYTVDETKPEKPQYNWGYDPLNYNVPEGSYSTNARDGYTRIREFKQLIKTMHENGIRVVMDVVYNHTMLTEDSWFNQLVPGYYYRQNKDGSFSNATACNNETASERPMMRKFILESVKYWVNEYHIDGFRFDLMGVHDIETMNLIAAELRKIKPDILLYGEGWTAGPSPLPEETRALKKNAYKLDNIAVFSDDIRDGIKGSVFEHEDRGFASGKKGMEESIKFGIVAATTHPQVNVAKVNYSKAFYATDPAQVVTYCECHDNHVLWDKLAISTPKASLEERRNMHKLSLGIVLTSQGISFLHAGTEFLRSKKGVENSFESGDSINAIDWGMKTLNKDVYEYVRGLIAMRRSHPAFRMTKSEEIAKHIRFISAKDNYISYTIDGAAVGDSWKKVFVAFNGSAESRKLELPAGNWKTHVANNAIRKASTPPKQIAAYSAVVLYSR